MNWELYSWVVRGKQRREVIIALNKPKIPTQITRETKLSITHVSKILKSFVERGLAECLTPEVRIGKVFVLTDIGKDIRDKIFDNNP